MVAGYFPYSFPRSSESHKNTRKPTLQRRATSDTKCPVPIQPTTSSRVIKTSCLTLSMPAFFRALQSGVLAKSPRSAMPTACPRCHSSLFVWLITGHGKWLRRPRRWLPVSTLLLPFSQFLLCALSLAALLGNEVSEVVIVRPLGAHSLSSAGFFKLLPDSVLADAVVLID